MRNRREWLKLRKSGIGGSDAGAILGVNSHKTAFQVYMEKTEDDVWDDEFDITEAAYWGSNFEELVAKEFTKRTGKKVRRDNRLLVHKRYPFMIANIDRRVVGEGTILECKTTSVYREKEWEGDKIPANYLMQCQHYMSVANASKCYLAVLIGGQKLIIKELIRDDELIATLIAAEKEFWTNHVEKRVPPKLDGSDAADKYLKKRFPKVMSTVEIPLKQENEAKLKKYLTLKEEIKSLQEEADSIEYNIKLELGDAEKGRVGDYAVDCKEVHASKAYMKTFKEKYPEAYKEVCIPYIYRRFEVRKEI